MDDAVEAARSTRARPVPLWRNRDYMLLWGGQAVSALGSGISQLAYPLLILALTHSPVQAGIAGALFTLPYLLLSLPAGALVDRLDRKRIMIVCDTVRGLNMASIPLVATLWHLTVIQLFITAIIEGTGFVFFNLAEVACLPRVVPTEQLPSASAQNEIAMSGANLIAPALSGFIYQTLGRTIPFLADAVSYSASVLSLLFIRAEFQKEREEVTARKLWLEVKEGLGWLWNQPLIRFMAFLTGGLNLISNGNALVLIVLAKHLGASPATIGLMFAIASIGGIVGAPIAPWIQGRFPFGQVIPTLVWIEALLFPLYAIAPNPLMLGVIFAAVAVTVPIYNAVQFSYRLALIPDQLQGRVNSVFRLLAFGLQPIGMVMAGALLQTIGPVTSVLVFSGGMLTLAFLTMANRHIRNVRPLIT